MAVFAASCLVASVATASGQEVTYEVKVTNLTKGQTFTPILGAAHRPGVRIFEFGEPASDELAALAEAGNTAPLSEFLQGLGPQTVGEVVTAPGLLAPGETRVFEVRGARGQTHFSLAAMLIPTNDTFIALRDVALPLWGMRVFDVPAHDAGSEQNDQNCAHIPGPRCGGEAGSAPAAGDEGFVSISNGFHDIGSEDSEGNEILGPFEYDWHNPVARVTVVRVR